MRKIFRIGGAERVTFLQKLVTNDVTKAPCYAALLTPQGKYLADFFLIPDEDSLLMDIDADLADAVVARLNMYRLRADVQITPTDIAVSRGTGPAPDGAIVDPRHPDLGWRFYGAALDDDGTDWDALRVAHCIPKSGIELIPNESYILEVGFERLHGVDFRKGCFVGQEVTARMKHKTELRKGLQVVTLSEPVAPGTAITRDGREIGVIFTQSGPQGIAYLRFDRVGPGMQAGDVDISAP